MHNIVAGKGLIYGRQSLPALTTPMRFYRELGENVLGNPAKRAEAGQIAASLPATSSATMGKGGLTISSGEKNLTGQDFY